MCELLHRCMQAQRHRSGEGKKVAPEDTGFERYTWVQDAM